MTIPVGWWFIPLLVIVGGLVAYYGDVIGRKIGKKRIKFKNLRPKDFAAISTSIAGGLGTLAVIVVLISFSEPVRVALFEGEKARTELGKVKKDLASETEKLQSASEMAKELEKKLGLKEGELDKMIAKLAETNKVRLSTEERNKNLVKESNQLSAKVTKFGGEVKTLSQEIAEYQAEREKLDKEIDSAKTNYNKLTGNNVLLQQRNLTLEADAIKLEKQYQQLEVDRAQIQEALNQLNSKFDQQSQQYSKEIKAAEEKLSATNRALESQRQALEDVRRTSDFFKNKATSARINPMIFSATSELSRSVLPKGSSFAVAKAALISLIREAREYAELKGAADTPEGSFAGLLPIELPDNRGIKYEADQINDFALNVLAARDFEILLIAKAAANAFESEFIPIVIDYRRNPVIYQKDEVIFTMQVDGRKDVPTIAMSIIDAVTTNFSDKLLRDGMVPIVGSAQPLGEFTNERIIAIAMEIKEIGRPIRLQFIASDVTEAGDRVRFSHRLRP